MKTPNSRAGSTITPLTVTVEEVKRLTGLGHTTIYALMKDGRLKSTTIGRRRMIDNSSLKALLAPHAA
jgi:excisionase family DNA binding protein